jgi:hypothetical protein
LKLFFWDLDETFDDNTIFTDRFTFDTGGGTLSASGGAGVPSSTATKRLYYNLAQRRYENLECVIHYKSGAVLTSGGIGIIARRQDASNLLFSFRDVSSTLAIKKRDGGSDSNLATDSSYTPVINTEYWMKFLCLDNDLRVEEWTSDPDDGGEPVAYVEHTLTGGNATEFGDGVFGEAGIYFTPNDLNWRIYNFKINGVTPGDLEINCRKTQPIQMREVQTKTTVTRDFQIILRASYPFWRNSAVLQTTGTISVLSDLGRVYDKGYDETYDTYLDADGDPISTTSPDSVVVNNDGTFASEPVIRIYGEASNPSISNLTTGEALTINGIIASEDYYDIDIKNKTIKDSENVNRFSTLDPSSDWLSLDLGENTLAVSVDDFSGSPRYIVYWRNTFI